VVTWVDDVFSVLAQTRVPNTSVEDKRRVMFINHAPGKIPVKEARGVAMAVAKNQAKKPMPLPYIPDFPPDNL
jgi:hypothetical protein